MGALSSGSELTPGAELEPKTYRATRLDLVKYAGASGDFNVIHWNERVAKSVGLPDVIAHGMYTMAQAGRYVTELAGGDPGRVTEFSVRFSAMVVVPDDDEGAAIEVTGVVAAEPPQAGHVAIEVTARQDGTKVLSRARAVIRQDLSVAASRPHHAGPGRPGRLLCRGRQR
jgi:acyl dehydratase